MFCLELSRQDLEFMAFQEELNNLGLEGGQIYQDDVDFNIITGLYIGYKLQELILKVKIYLFYLFTDNLSKCLLITSSSQSIKQVDTFLTMYSEMKI